MPSLTDALDEVRSHLMEPHGLVRAVGSGRRRGAVAPPRIEIRLVTLAKGPHLQVLTATDRAPLTHNLPLDPGLLAAAVDELLARPYANWHVETLAEVLQVRVTKSGQALVHRGRPEAPSGAEADRGGGGTSTATAHDRVKQHLLAPDDPIFTAIGADADKRRQVDAFLRQLQASLKPALARALAQDRPLRVVDLGCGNAYLTLAAHHWLAAGPAISGVETLGIEVRADVQRRNDQLVDTLGLTGVSFVVAPIAEAEVQGPVDVVLALHACDTATDDALARAIGWGAEVILAAPCCHHDVQRQIADHLRHGGSAPAGYEGVIASPILRERLGDVLTDALRAQILGRHGYLAEVVEFIDSRHTPRNALIRARRWAGVGREVPDVAPSELATQWGLRPRLAELLGDRTSPWQPTPGFDA